MRKYLFCITVLAVMTLVSCGKSGDSRDGVPQDIQLSESVSPSEKLEDITADSAGIPTAELPLNTGNPVKMVDWDKKIIKTADIAIELENYNVYNNHIHTQIKNFGAYIASENQVQSENIIENTVTIKVPVEQFDALLNSLPSTDVKILEKKIYTDDVTGEVVDGKSRIEAKKQVRAQYLELLKEAKSMKSILEVQHEINDIQEEIEAGTGRVKYLVSQSAYSTVNLKYHQYLNGLTDSDTKPSFVSEFGEALKNGSQIITQTLILTASLWPLLLGGFIVWFLVKRWKVRAAPLKVDNAAKQ